jgi:outer membrane lipoprotein-sorting protein
VMKLPSGMLGDSWMGSDFTNDDLVKGSSLSKDFDAKVNGVVDVDGKKAWSITLVPTKSATVVWGKIEMQVDRASCLPVDEKFYDENNKLARTMTFSDFKKIGWRDFPGKMTVKPGDGGRETTVQYDDVTFDGDIPDDTFSVHRLEQGR